MGASPTWISSFGYVWATMGNIWGDDFPQKIKREARELGKILVIS